MLVVACSIADDLEARVASTGPQVADGSRECRYWTVGLHRGVAQDHTSGSYACRVAASFQAGRGRIFVLDDGHGLVGVIVTNASVHSIMQGGTSGDIPADRRIKI